MAKSFRLWDSIVSRLGNTSRKFADRRKRLNATKSRHLQLEQCEDRLLLSIAPVSGALAPEEEVFSVEEVIAHASTTSFDQWEIDWGDTSAEVESRLLALLNDPRWIEICRANEAEAMAATTSPFAYSSIASSWTIVGPVLPSSTQTESTLATSPLLGGGMTMMLMSGGPTTISMSGPTTVNEGTPITLTADLSNLADTLTKWAINWGDGTPVVEVTPPASGNDWGDGVEQSDADTWTFTHTYADGLNNHYVSVQAELRDTEQSTTTIGAYYPLIPGDANLDGIVDGSDATILAGYWMAGPGATWSMGDFNGDGYVDGSDATILAGYWQQSISSGSGGIEVNNVEPTLTISGDLDIEIGEYTVTIVANDPGTDDITSLDINWGDGSSHTTGINGCTGPMPFVARKRG